MSNRIDESMNLLCEYCDFKNTDFIKLNMKTYKYEIHIDLMIWFLQYYQNLFEFQKFIPLIAFSNFYDCLSGNTNYYKNKKNATNINFKFIDE